MITPTYCPKKPSYKNMTNGRAESRCVPTESQRMTDLRKNKRGQMFCSRTKTMTLRKNLLMQDNSTLNNTARKLVCKPGHRHIKTFLKGINRIIVKLTGLIYFQLANFKHTLTFFDHKQEIQQSPVIRKIRPSPLRLFFKADLRILRKKWEKLIKQLSSGRPGEEKSSCCLSQSRLTTNSRRNVAHAGSDRESKYQNRGEQISKTLDYDITVSIEKATRKHPHNKTRKRPRLNLTNTAIPYFLDSATLCHRETGINNELKKKGKTYFYKILVETNHTQKRFELSTIRHVMSHTKIEAQVEFSGYKSKIKHKRNFPDVRPKYPLTELYRSQFDKNNFDVVMISEILYFNTHGKNKWNTVHFLRKLKNRPNKCVIYRYICNCILKTPKHLHECYITKLNPEQRNNIVRL